MAKTQINIECEDTLKEAFERKIKLSGYSTISEAIRDFMRKVANMIDSEENHGNN